MWILRVREQQAFFKTAVNEPNRDAAFTVMPVKHNMFKLTKTSDDANKEQPEEGLATNR